MARLEINVKGTATVSRLAERAVLDLAVYSEGSNQDVVSQEVTSTVNNLRNMSKELAPKTKNGAAAPNAAVTVFSTSSLTTRSWLPTDKHGSVLTDAQRQYRVEAHFEVIFRDFDKLAEVTTTLFKMSRVEIRSTNWRLTDETLKLIKEEVRKAAMVDAMKIAKDYAEVVGREVFAVEINDAPTSTGARTKQTARVSSSSIQSTGLSLEPEDVEMSASVTAKFVAE